jgi:hypothetical protein
MVNFTAVSLLALSHLNCHKGMGGSVVAMQIGKVTILAATMASLAAIIELG